MSIIEITGRIDAPAVVVLGGISSSKHVTATAANNSRGWWNDFVGPSKPIDTLHFRVIGMDYLEGNRDEPLSTHHQASALLDALDAAGVGNLHAVVGASYGGMVALSLAELYPSRVERLIVIGAAHQSTASATAHRSLQRRVVELGFRAGLEADALCIARGMAITTYSTPSDFENRFELDDPLEREREIQRFLTLTGSQFMDRCSPGKFLELSRSLDLHCVNPDSITCPTTLIGVIEDYLVPPSQLRRLAENISGPCELALVSSIHGHDAFLDDQSLIAPIVKRALLNRERNAA
jgi:homoserine O-acetyltransferase